MPAQGPDRHAPVGSRQHWRPTSPVYRAHALELTRALAERYGSLDACNDAWGTAFWSQCYTDWAQVLPPHYAGAGSFRNPTQELDFRRFSSDALLAHDLAERDVLREVTPDVPVTTNFMVMGETQHADDEAWADEMDVVSNDHDREHGADTLVEQSFPASLTATLARGEPWFLMEQRRVPCSGAASTRPTPPGAGPGSARRRGPAAAAGGGAVTGQPPPTDRR